MGKKALLKTIRRIAETLPAMQKPSEAKRVLRGSYLIENGVTTLKDNTSVDPNKYYSADIDHDPVNHAKAMKKALQKGGFSAMGSYIAAVKRKEAELTAAENDTTEETK